MSRSFFNAFSGIAAYQRSLQVVADNMANVNTNAFKRSEASFTDLLYSVLREKRYSVDPLEGAQEPKAGKGSRMYPVTRFFEQGPLLLTDRPLDIGLEGRGFFRLTREDGTEAYTRRGAFYVDDDGEIVTDRGEYLDVNFNLAGLVISTVVIGTDGRVSGRDLNGNWVDRGRIMLYSFVNEEGLEKLDSGLFAATEAAGEAEEIAPGTENAARLRQYSLEGSNVNLSAEMVNLITSQRAFQANVRSLITADELKALTLLVRG